MNKGRIIAFVLLLLLAGRAPGQEIRKVTMDDVVRIIDSSTQPVVVNFWATWCEPCVHELTWFEKTISAYRSKNVQLIMVSLDFVQDYPKGIRDFMVKNGYTAQVVWLTETNAEVFCPKIDRSWSGTIPVTLLVNNKTHYRRFIDLQVPEGRLKLELDKLTE